MSASLVRKALDLFSDDLNKDLTAKKSAKVQQLTTNRYGLKKEKKKMQQRTQRNYNKGKTTVKDKRIKSVIDEYKRKQEGDRTEDNLYIFQKLNAAKPQKAVIEKIIDHHQKSLSRNKIRETAEPNENKLKSVLFPELNIENSGSDSEH